MIASLWEPASWTALRCGHTPMAHCMSALGAGVSSWRAAHRERSASSAKQRCRMTLRPLRCCSQDFDAPLASGRTPLLQRVESDLAFSRQDSAGCAALAPFALRSLVIWPATARAPDVRTITYMDCTASTSRVLGYITLRRADP